MSDTAALIANYLDIWIGTIDRKNGPGRGGGKRIRPYGSERMRALILDLAVRGKLVRQHPLDEPAWKYLGTAPQRLDPPSPKRRRKQILPEIPDDLELPPGWTQAHLSSIVEIVRGITFPGSEKSKNSEFGRVACLRTSNVQEQIEWNDILYIKDKFVSRPDQYIHQHDIIISMANSRELVGKVAIIASVPDSPTTFGGFLAAIRPHSVDPFYLLAFLRSPTTKAQLINDASQTTNIANISLSKLNPLVVPLPPLAEQRRIVAKVEELMSLCDALERESTDALVAHQTLVETLLATLVNCADAADLAPSWARLEMHFDTLFTTEASIDALKQTILDLAVRGKLVEQDAGSQRGPIPLRKFIGPMDAGWSPACQPFPAQTDGAWGVLKTTAVQFLRYVQEENKELPAKLAPRPEAECRAGDILITRAGPTNRVGIVCYVPETRARLMISDKIIRFRPASGDIDGEYLALALSVGPAAAQIDAAKSGMAASQVNISQAKLRDVTVRIPQLAEQRRIVAKVDELIGVCDALKARLAEADETRRYLADAITQRAAA